MEVQSLLRPLTKGIWIIKKKKEVTRVFNEAINQAFSGRMGPVVIEIPDDIQRAFISLRKNKNNLITQKKKFFLIKKNISNTIKLIKDSKRPIIIAGYGITLSKSAKLVKKFAKNTNIPYLYTWASADQFNFNDKLNAGSFGVAATRAGNFSLQNSDLIIGLGVRLSPSIVGANPNLFAPKAKKILVEIDKNEFLNHRMPKVDLKINSDVNFFLKKIINKKIGKKKNDAWIKKVNFFKKNYPAIPSNKIFKKNYVDPYFFFENLSHLIKEKSILIPDTSANLIWAMQAFKILKKVKIFTAFNHSPMGYSIAASIGAYFGVGGRSKNIIATIGDGSVPMNVQELETIKNYKINVKIFVFNNRGYSLIKQTQETWLDGRYSGVNKESGLNLPNNLKIANSYGIKSIYIKNNNELKKKLFSIINTRGPVLVDLNIDPSCRVEPKLDYGSALHDMSPKLPKEEITNNMIS